MAFLTLLQQALGAWISANCPWVNRASCEQPTLSRPSEHYTGCCLLSLKG